MSDVSLSYAELEQMAASLDQAVYRYQDIQRAMSHVGATMLVQCFVGQTGRAADAYMQGFNQRLEKMMARTVALKVEVQQVINLFREQVDPGAAQRFEK